MHRYLPTRDLPAPYRIRMLPSSLPTAVKPSRSPLNTPTASALPRNLISPPPPHVSTPLYSPLPLPPLLQVLGKPCWLDLKHTPSACGSSEPTIANILQRAKHPHTRPGYGNITLGPTGPLPWPVLSSPGGAHLCMRSWRGGFTQRNAVAFQQCPQDRSRGLHRWGGAELFAWELTSVDGSPVTPGYPSEAVTVNLRPQAARHMCLTAPPLHVAHGSGSNPAGGERGEGNEEGGRGARSSRRQVKLSTRKVVQAKRASALT